MSFTVIGASGFIGSALSARLRAAGEAVFEPARGAVELFTQPLGHVVYAAGVTADFRERPFDTLRANTGLLADVLERARFDSLVYLSSARVYRHSEVTSEAAAITLRPRDPEDLYDLTKLTGEALCHASGRSRVRVVRLSNVVGLDFASKNFLSELIRSACDRGHIELRSAPQSAKDYVLLDDVLDLLPRIALSGRHDCYNLGSGLNLTHAEIVGAIVSRTDAKLSVTTDAAAVVSRPVDINRIRDEFGFEPRPVLDYIPHLIDAYRQKT
jgi:nucleoside-diphosphate-sugar epimerase